MNNFCETLKQIGASRYMQCSPVSYIPALLQQYADSEIDGRMLYQLFRSQTRDAQFFFMHMPQEHINENKRLFKNEFDFADEMWSILSSSHAEEDAVLRERILRCMEDYLAAPPVSEA